MARRRGGTSKATRNSHKQRTALPWAGPLRTSRATTRPSSRRCSTTSSNRRRRRADLTEVAAAAAGRSRGAVWRRVSPRCAVAVFAMGRVRVVLTAVMDATICVERLRRGFWVASCTIRAQILLLLLLLLGCSRGFGFWFLVHELALRLGNGVWPGSSFLSFLNISCDRMLWFIQSCHIFEPSRRT